MDYDEMKKSIIQEWELIKGKKVGNLTKGEEKKIELWWQNSEIRVFLPDGGAFIKMFRKYPQLEILLVKAPIESFSKWYEQAEEKKKFQKTQFINDLIYIYKKCLESKRISREAEFIRLGLANEYKKCI